MDIGGQLAVPDTEPLGHFEAPIQDGYALLQTGFLLQPVFSTKT